MNIKVDTRCMTNDDIEAQVLRAIMFAVFEDYIAETSAEEFQRLFGTRGTECLSKYTKLEG
jgi:hypothetical protein